MILANRQAQYKYSQSGTYVRQEKNRVTKNPTKRRFTWKGQFPFLKDAVSIAFVVAVIGMVVIAYVHQFVQISTVSYEIETLNKVLKDVTADNEKIALKIEQHNSLKHIEKEARGRLGLVEPTEVYYLSMSTESNDANQPAAEAGEKKAVPILAELGDWLRNLTSVEAGTLDE